MGENKNKKQNSNYKKTNNDIRRNNKQCVYVKVRITG